MPHTGRTTLMSGPSTGGGQSWRRIRHLRAATAELATGTPAAISPKSKSTSPRSIPQHPRVPAHSFVISSLCYENITEFFSKFSWITWIIGGVSRATLGCRRAVTNSDSPQLRWRDDLEAVVPQEGFEPPTTRLRSGCSTTELLRLIPRVGHQMRERLSPCRRRWQGCAAARSAGHTSATTNVRQDP